MPTTTTPSSAKPDELLVAKPYSPRSDALYENLTRKGQLVTVAAPTGRGKSLIAANCSAYVIQRGGKAVWINLELPASIVKQRFMCTLFDFPIDDSEKPEFAAIRSSFQQQYSALQWRVFDLSSPSSAGHSFDNLITQVIKDNPDIIIVDGFDRLFTAEATNAFKEQCQRLATTAGTANICILVTSQMTRGSESDEILGVNQLAFTAGKAEASGLVVTLGHRVMHELRTITVVKDRNRIFRDQHVFRVYTRPSLRLEVMAVGSSIPSTPVYPDPEYVNCTTQDCVSAPALEIDDEMPDTSGTGLKLYHGKKGFVALGRGIFTTAMYQERDWESLGRLLSLYEMAAISTTSLYAPGTKAPVIIKRGQVLVSLQILAARWDIDRSKVRRFLEHAQRNGLIAVSLIKATGMVQTSNETTNDTTEKALGSVITLCHYDGNEGANMAFGAKE
jgi:hypothetical protein